MTDDEMADVERWRAMDADPERCYCGTEIPQSQEQCSECRCGDKIAHPPAIPPEPKEGEA